MVGEPSNEEFKNLSKTVFENFIPNRVVLSQVDANSEISRFKILKGRDQVYGKPTAYLCRNYNCQFPTNDPSELMDQLLDKNI